MLRVPALSSPQPPAPGNPLDPAAPPTPGRRAARAPGERGGSAAGRRAPPPPRGPAPGTWCSAVSPSTLVVLMRAPRPSSRFTSSVSPLEQAARKTAPSSNFTLVFLRLTTGGSRSVSEPIQRFSCSFRFCLASAIFMPRCCLAPLANAAPRIDFIPPVSHSAPRPRSPTQPDGGRRAGGSRRGGAGRPPWQKPARFPGGGAGAAVGRERGGSGAGEGRERGGLRSHRRAGPGWPRVLGAEAPTPPPPVV